MTQHSKILQAIKFFDKPNWYFPGILHIMQYNARIKELRGRGIDIECIKKNGNTFWYRLKTDYRLIDFDKAKLI